MNEMTTSDQSQADKLKQSELLGARAYKAQRDRNPGEALRLARQSLKLYPGQSKSSLLISGILLRAGNIPEALQVLKEALKYDKDNHGLWNNIGSVYKTAEKLAPARACFEKAINLNGNYRLSWNNLLQIQLENKDAEGALHSITEMVSKFGDEEKLTLSRAQALTDLERIDEAVAVYESLFQKPPFSGSAVEKWVRLKLKQAGNEAGSIERLQSMSIEDPDNPDVWASLGALENRLGNSLLALDAYRKAQALKPDSIKYNHDIGIVERHIGNIEEAHKWFGRCLEIDPFYPPALRVYGTEHKYQYGDDSFNRLNRAAARITEMKPEHQVQIHYAMGKAFDDLGDLGTAFEHFRNGGAKHLKLNPDDGSKRGSLFYSMKRRLTAEHMANPVESGCEDPTPVFILGMPRSGTSLTEQVLASHSGVYGAGELKLFSKSVSGVVVGKGLEINFTDAPSHWPPGTKASFAERGQKYVEELKTHADAAYARIVDKMPSNYLWVGMIHLFLPKASIIHTRRHPVEICLSCYRIFFPDGQLWSYDLRKLGRAYREYDEIMKHWNDILPEGRMLNVRYEDMVNDFENQAKKVIEYCRLDWEDSCLDFHNTDRPVKTASASQVRKPIYKTSTNRWRKYEPYLGPLLEELGPLVENYESELIADYPEIYGSVEQ